MDHDAAREWDHNLHLRSLQATIRRLHETTPSEAETRRVIELRQEAAKQRAEKEAKADAKARGLSLQAAARERDRELAMLKSLIEDGVIDQSLPTIKALSLLREHCPHRVKRFRCNILERFAIVRCWTGGGRYRDYRVASGETVDVIDVDAPVFRSRPRAFAEIQGET